MEFFFSVLGDLIFLLGVDLVLFVVENYGAIIAGAVAMAAASYGYRRYKLGKGKAPSFDALQAGEGQGSVL